MADPRFPEVVVPELVAEPVLDDPGNRGSLTIRNRAASRIVELAALEVPGVIRRDARLGRGLPRAVVDMTPFHPNIRVDVAVAWPSPIATVCQHVRMRVVADLDRFTGRQPSRVDVSVAEVVVDVDAESTAEIGDTKPNRTEADAR
ncbi:Asp23/Gls24 family envelope stress response protein [Antrihabitans sp. YC2-6]|uniref:Asp23/Gls24 family envelope stress response protein n=1 Tax=Antrihabitans sp. YC2-6 TaxID=2799498 RepID=UPI0018F2CF16|nr:Asp23/Gls24 family envelope stress response protein [Antrihabitans sp. YC2-6]MBJ8348715.1 Asp23/Gls24 family envelope stress response protein [Antrihabitans sp. YC2-6]